MSCVCSLRLRSIGHFGGKGRVLRLSGRRYVAAGVAGSDIVGRFFAAVLVLTFVGVVR